MTHTAFSDMWNHGDSEGFVRKYSFPCYANHVQVDRGAPFTLDCRDSMRGSQGLMHQVLRVFSKKWKAYLDLKQQLYIKSEIGVSSVMCKGSGGTDFFISYTLK